MSDRRNAVVRLGLRSTTAALLILGALLLASRYRVVAGWNTVTATVEQAIVLPSADSRDSRAPGERFVPLVEYTYRIDGRTYSSDHVAVHDWVFRDRDRARAYLARHNIARGVRVPAYVDPRDPEMSVLVRSLPWFRLEVLAVVLVMVVLPVGVVLYSIVDVIRGGVSRSGDGSRGRMW